MRLKRCLLSAVLILSVMAAARAGEYSVRFFAFSDNITRTTYLPMLVQNLLKERAGEIRLDKVELTETYVKGSAYILPQHDEVLPDEAASLERHTMPLGNISIIEDDSSVLVQHPVPVPGLNQKILALDSQYLVYESTTPALLGAVNKEGDLVEIVDEGGLSSDSKWVVTSALNYYISVNGVRTVVSVIIKPQGGFGAWFDTVRKRKAEFFSPTLVLALGDMPIASGIDGADISSAALAAYWTDSGVDAVTFDGHDIPSLWPLISSGWSGPGQKPDIVCSNMQVSQSSSSILSQYAVREVDGVKLGILSFVEKYSDVSGGKYPVTFLDPVSAARDLVSRLRKDEKVDFILAVSHLGAASRSRLAGAVPGIDMILDDEDTRVGGGKDTHIDLSSWQMTGRRTPAYIAGRKLNYPSEIVVEFNDFRDAKIPVSIEDRDTASYLKENLLSNPYYAYTEKFVGGLLRDSPYVLPDIRDLLGLKDNSRWAYTSSEFFSLAASVVRSELKTEAAFLRRRPLANSGIGRIFQPVARSWFLSNPMLYRGRLPGSQIKQLIKYISAEDSADDTELQISASGADGDNRVDGLSITDSENYYVVIAEDLLSDENLKQVKDAFKGEPVPSRLADVVLGWLVRQKDKADRDALDNYSSYIGAMKTQKELVTDKTARRLFDDNDFAALWSYSEDRAYASYYALLRNTMAPNTSEVRLWRFNLKSLSFQYSNLRGNNTSAYSNVSDARLRATDQIFMQGSGVLVSEYIRTKWRMDTRLSMDYGKVKLMPADSDPVENETVDKILLENEFTYRMRRLDKLAGGVTVGPFCSLGYDTEFVPADGVPRRKIVRGKGGIKLFEGSIIKDFYFAGVTEQDFTYSPTHTKYAWETGVEATFQLPRTQHSLTLKGSYKDFFRTQSDVSTDLKDELELDAKLQVQLFGNFKLSPYLNYYRVLGMMINSPADNFVFGVSLDYSFLFKPVF